MDNDFRCIRGRDNSAGCCVEQGIGYMNDRGAAVGTSNDPAGEKQHRLRLATLLQERRAASGMTYEDLAAKVGVNRSVVESRLKGLSRFHVYGELQSYISALDVSGDAVIDVLFPDAGSASEEISTELRETRMQLESARSQLDDLKSSGGPELGLVRDLASTGRWAVGVSPHHAGPAADRRVLQSVRLAITAVDSARAEIEAEGRSVRELFNEECGKIVRDRAIFISDSLPDKPRAPWDVPDSDVVHMGIRMFAGDRVPHPTPRSLPKFRPQSVVVLSTTQEAWADQVSGVVAKALGWGLLDSSSVHRMSHPVDVGPRDEFVEQMNTYRNAGLSETLGEPRSQFIVHHTGRPGLGDGPLGHPLVEAAPDAFFRERMPFVVLLSETDRAIRKQADKVRRFDDGTPRFSEDQWVMWRDDLRSCVESLPPGRFTVHDVDLTDSDGSSSESESTLRWQRTAKLADEILRVLRDWGGLSSPSIDITGDHDALKILHWLRY